MKPASSRPRRSRSPRPSCAELLRRAQHLLEVARLAPETLFAEIVRHAAARRCAAARCVQLRRIAGKAAHA